MTLDGFGPGRGGGVRDPHGDGDHGRGHMGLGGTDRPLAGRDSDEAGSGWRERRGCARGILARFFKFVLNQVRRSIEPAFPLAHMIGEWQAISDALAEPPVPQLPDYFG